MNEPIYFAQIKEDSRIEHQISIKYNVKKSICIGSGGCTALSLLTDSAQSVSCIDSNSSQTNLIELKSHYIKKHERNEFLKILGEDISENNSSINNLLILDSEISHLNLFVKRNPDLAFYGLNHCGITEKYYRFIASQLFKNFDQLNTIGEKKLDPIILKKLLSSPEFSTAIRILLSQSMHMLFFSEKMFSKSSEIDFGSYFLNNLFAEISKDTFKTNYFFTQFLFAKYITAEEHGMPPYLTPSGFIETKRNINKLFIVNMDIISYLADSDTFDAFFLSNIFDWLPDDMVQLLCRRILEKSKPGTIIFFRNLFSVTKLPSFFITRIKFDAHESKKYLLSERSMMYRNIAFGRVK